MDKKLHILIVDDNPLNLELLKDIIESEGYMLTIAFSGQEALDVAQDTPLDLILLDVHMPGMDGYEVCKHFKAEDQLRDIPIIFLTAVTGAEDKLKGFEVGGVDYITKPFYPKEVVARMKAHLLLRNAQTQLQEQNKQLQNEMIRRKQLEDALKDSEQRYRQILENASEAVFTTDLLGFFTYANPVMLNRSGYSIEELIGKHFTELIEETWRERVLNFYQKQLIDRVHETILTFPLFKFQDKQTWVEQTTNLVIDGDNITGFLGISRDVTERKKVEADRERLITELDAFAHTVAHDLKTPLSTLALNSDMLETMFDNISEERRNKILRRIQATGQKMTDIVNSLLLLASIRQQEDLVTQSLDMRHIVAEALKGLKIQIEQCDADIIVADAFPSVLGYAPWIEEVWMNYLSNALKYSGNPPSIRIGADTLNNGSVCFWVKDNGTGLSEEDQMKIFIPFTRLNQINIKGHGLGLSIVQRIVEKLGGTASVDSEIGQGSTFYFTLPTS